MVLFLLANVAVYYFAVRVPTRKQNVSVKLATQAPHYGQS